MGHIAAFANATIGLGLTKAYSGVCKMLLQPSKKKLKKSLTQKNK